MDIRRVPTNHPDFVTLVAELDAYLADIDGEEHNFYAQYNTIDQLDEAVVAYRDGDAIGCGAMKEFDSAAMEVKRMYTKPSQRGQGVAIAVLEKLESLASLLGYQYCVLETGQRQKAAVQLYTSQAYEVTDSYGQYIGVDNSLCFRKEIAKSPFTIREIAASDNESLASIIRAVFIEHDAPQQGTVYSDPTTDDLYTLFSVPKSQLWVAEKDTKIVGCGGIYPTVGLPDGCVEFVKFYLAPSARGLGLGRALLEQCLYQASKLGYDTMYIESLPHYSKAVTMYERYGFKHLDRQLGQSGHTTCNIWMSKTL